MSYFLSGLFGVMGLGLLFVSFWLLQPPSSPPKDIYGSAAPPPPQKGIEGTLLVFAMALFLLCMAGWFLYIMLRRRTLEKTGQILLGKLISIKASYYRGNYMVAASYHFKNPEGTILTGKRKLMRNDLRKRVLPLPDTPVAVLYAHDTYYDIL